MKVYHLDGNKEEGESALKIAYKEELNEQQYAVVSSGNGISLVIAGAGSGKTRTLTYRVAWLIEHGVRPWEILLLTFTNKAAREMLGRVRELLPDQAEGVIGGTFHSFGNRVLRRYADVLGYTKDFTILDADDQKSLMAKIMKERGLSVGKGRESQGIPKAEVILSFRSLAVNECREVLGIIKARYKASEEQEEIMLSLITEYERRKRESNSMDFDDLLANTVEVLERNAEARAHYARRFRAVLVDEYQDTNNLQDKMIGLLIEQHRNLMAVGDDAQSIYSWRGANLAHILEFTLRYEDATLYKIETNYRSCPPILNLSNVAISRNENRIEKTLIAVRETNRKLPVMAPARTASHQAKFVVQRIRELHEEGLALDEIAVLYRAHYQSLELQLELAAARIPFRMTSGMGFFEQAHMKDVMAFLRLRMNPRDNAAFDRLMTMIPGVGPATTAKAWQAWSALPLEDLKSLSLHEACARFPIPQKGAGDWEQIRYTMDEIVHDTESPSKMIEIILEAFYDTYAKLTFDNYDQRLSDIRYLAEFASEFEDLTSLLSQCSLLTNTDATMNAGASAGGKSAEGGVTLSTVHQAKGLEWHTVFVIGLADGLFPLRRAVDAGRKELEEERRLFYVAITRAKDELYMSYPMFGGYGGGEFLDRTSFLDGITEDMVELWLVN